LWKRIKALRESAGRRSRATYLAPLISKRADQPASATPQALSGLLKQLRQAVGAGMPPALDGFYRALP